MLKSIQEMQSVYENETKWNTCFTIGHEEDLLETTVTYKLLINPSQLEHVKTTTIMFFIFYCAFFTCRPSSPSFTGRKIWPVSSTAFLICICQNREITFAGEVSRKKTAHIIFICVCTGKRTHAVTVHCHMHFSQSATNSSALLFWSHAVGEMTLVRSMCTVVNFYHFGNCRTSIPRQRSVLLWRNAGNFKAKWLIDLGGSSHCMEHGTSRIKLKLHQMWSSISELPFHRSSSAVGMH